MVLYGKLFCETYFSSQLIETVGNTSTKKYYFACLLSVLRTCVFAFTNWILVETNSSFFSVFVVTVSFYFLFIKICIPVNEKYQKMRISVAQVSDSKQSSSTNDRDADSGGTCSNGASRVSWTPILSNTQVQFAKFVSDLSWQ